VPAGEDSVGILNGLIDELSTEFSTELSDASPQLIEIPTEEQEYWKMLRQTQEKNDLSSLMSATALPDLDRAENGIFVPQQYLKLTMPGNKKLANLYARAKTKYQKVKERNRPVYHFRVCRDNWKGKRLCVLQYWFFYAFNDWKIAHKGYNDHEGDWEMITVFLQLKQEKDLEPVAVAYSRHISKETVKWQKISPITMGQLNKHSGPARLGNHPLVFVGCGSHASYPERGRHHLNKRDYALGNSDIILPQGSATQGRLKWARPIQIDNKVWNWNFKGGWGAHIGALGALYGAWGPDGPAHKESWDKPADWARP
jgi:hypothetical protein